MTTTTTFLKTTTTEKKPLVGSGGHGTHLFAPQPRPRPYENLPHLSQKGLPTTTDRLQNAIERSIPYPKTPASARRAAAAAQSSNISDAGSGSPRQILFDPSSAFSSLPLKLSPPSLGPSSLKEDAEQAAADPDPEAAKIALRIEKARQWVDGQLSLPGSPMADLNSSPCVEGEDEKLEKTSLNRQNGSQRWKGRR